jgi:hypothetical protein
MIVFRFYFESLGFRWQDLLTHIFFLKRFLNIRFVYILNEVVLGHILSHVRRYADDFWPNRFLFSPAVHEIFLFTTFIRPVVSLIDIFLI